MKRFASRLSRSQVFATLAYGLFLSCTSVILWGGYIPFVHDALSSSEALLVDFFARGVSFPISLFVAAAVAYRSPKALRWRSPWVALALFVLGGGALLAQGLWGIQSPVVTLVVGICFGWGSGLMFCSLQQVIAAQKVFSAGFIVFAAAGLSAIVFFLMESLPASVIPWASFCLLIPLAAILTASARNAETCTHPMLETIPRQRTDRCREAVIELWRPLLCIAFSAFIVGIIRIDSLADGGALRQVNASNMFGLLVASFVLLVTWHFIYERIGLNKLYLVLFPLTATAFLLLPLFEGSMRYAFVSFEFLVFSITSSLMVISCARTARNQCLPPVLVYGAFAGIVYAFSVFGSLAGYVLERMQNESSILLFVIALAAIYVLSLAMTMQRKRQRGETFREAKQAPSWSSDEVIGRRCAAVAERYGLSNRESEVLLLLAKGRDVPFIAEELVISKNTVRTHSKSIFMKMSVHSRQELIDLVEQTEH